MRKIILKVRDLEFEDTQTSVQDEMENAKKVLNTKGYFFDGILLSVNTKIAYVWKEMKAAKSAKPENIPA